MAATPGPRGAPEPNSFADIQTTRRKPARCGCSMVVTAPTARSSNEIDGAKRACLADWQCRHCRLVPELVAALVDRGDDGPADADRDEHGFRKLQGGLDGFGHGVGGAQLVESLGVPRVPGARDDGQVGTSERAVATTPRSPRGSPWSRPRPARYRGPAWSSSGREASPKKTSWPSRRAVSIRLGATLDRESRESRAGQHVGDQLADATVADDQDLGSPRALAARARAAWPRWLLVARPTKRGADRRQERESEHRQGRGHQNRLHQTDGPAGLRRWPNAG